MISVSDPQAGYQLNYDRNRWDLKATPETIPSQLSHQTYQDLTFRLATEPKTYVFFRLAGEATCDKAIGLTQQINWWSDRLTTTIANHQATIFSGEEPYYYHESWWISAPSNCLEIGVFDHAGNPNHSDIQELIRALNFPNF